MPRQSLALLWLHIRRRLFALVGLIALIWIVHIVNWAVFDGALVRYGIRPWTMDGLQGLLFAHFLHAHFHHLIANTLPLAILGWLVVLRCPSDLVVVGVVVGVLGGLGTWLLGSSNEIHIGASMMVFGFLGYLISFGLIARRPLWILLSVAVVAAYEGMLWGVFPGRPGVSWQGHLAGFLAGIVAAVVMGKRLTRSALAKRAEAERAEEMEAFLADSRAVVTEPDRSVPTAR